MIRSSFPGEVLTPISMVLNSLMVGDWKSLLLNFGGTGPVPTLGWSARAVVQLIELVEGPAEREGDELLVGAVMLEVIVLVEGPAERGGELLVGAVMLEVIVLVEGPAERGGELLEVIVLVEGPAKRGGELLEVIVLVEGPAKRGGELLEVIVLVEGPAEREGDELLVGLDCACLACFLAAALVCQPHEHGLTSEGLKKDPCWHFFMEAIAATTSLLVGFWPLPANTGRPSARSINLLAYCPMPRKWWDPDMSLLLLYIPPNQEHLCSITKYAQY